MKDKEMIEEMAKDIHEELETENIPYYECDFMAQRLISKGWIKPDKDSVVQPTIQSYSTHDNDLVVLSREEYEKLKLELAIEKKRADESYTQKEVEEIIASKERIKSKETAEQAFEITKKIIDKKYAIETPWTRATLSNIINQIEKEFAKRFSVEIKEN